MAEGAHRLVVLLAVALGLALIGVPATAASCVYADTARAVEPARSAPPVATTSGAETRSDGSSARSEPRASAEVVHRSSGAFVAAKAGAEGVDQGFAVGASFRSFSQFKRVMMGPAGPGREWHHLVEQTPGNVARFGDEAIQNTGNLIRLDVDVHRKVSGFYSSKQPFTGGQTVRQWLSGQSYAKQQQFSNQTIRRFGGQP